MIALALLLGAVGWSLVVYAALRTASAADEALERYPEWNPATMLSRKVTPDWDWPDPHPSITKRKAHNGTENRPT